MAIKENKVKYSFRALKSNMDLIDQASQISSLDRTAFMMQASLQAAKNVLLEQRFIELPDEQFEALKTYLESPVEFNPNLMETLKSKAPWEK